MIVGFEVISCGREVGIWVEKGLRVVEVEEILVEYVVLTKRVRVKDVGSGAFVVIGFLEGGDLAVDRSSVVAGGEVWVSAVNVVEKVELCGLAVDLFGVSSKSASGEGKKRFYIHIVVI